MIKPSAAREIEAVDQKKDRQRIVTRIHSLADDPRPDGCEKLAGQQDRYRIRAGRYRILYSIQDEELIVIVVKVGHRREVYR
ncbi:MAG: type II toxin-antitoxin system RelE family toxin [Acidobacteriota bacterium]